MTIYWEGLFYQKTTGFWQSWLCVFGHDSNPTWLLHPSSALFSPDEWISFVFLWPWGIRFNQSLRCLINRSIKTIKRTANLRPTCSDNLLISAVWRDCLKNPHISLSGFWANRKQNLWSLCNWITTTNHRDKHLSKLLFFWKVRKHLVVLVR